jgi:NNP family nitrate/nitrite transporter-like MFS transporter
MQLKWRNSWMQRSATVTDEAVNRIGELNA